MLENLTKKCSNSKCEQINPQPIVSFAKNRTQSDGFNGWCRACEKGRQANYRQTEEGKAAMARGHKKYFGTEKGKISLKKYAKSPKGKASIAVISKRHRQSPKGKAAHAAVQANRRAAKLQATPPWLTKDQKRQNKSFFILAKEQELLSERKLHVDHIIPLQGDDVSGLHVPWNLQILPENINTSKNNKFDQIAYDKEQLLILIKKSSQS